MCKKLLMLTIFTFAAFVFLGFLNVTAHAADCDSRFYLNGAKPTDNGSRQYDGYLLYTGKSPGTAETVCVTERTVEGYTRRYIVERILLQRKLGKNIGQESFIAGLWELCYRGQ